MEDFDLGDLTQIDDVAGRGKSDYDIRYLESREKWEVSELIFNHANLDENALSMYVHKDAKVIISIQDREHSEFMRGRSDSETKSRTFTNRKLRDLLDRLGHEGVNNFALVPVGEKTGPDKVGRYFYAVAPWNDREISPVLESILDD
jgi:hypothetical protein